MKTGKKQLQKVLATIRYIFECNCYFRSETPHKLLVFRRDNQRICHMVFIHLKLFLAKVQLHKIVLQYEILSGLSFPNEHVQHPSRIKMSAGEILCLIYKN